MDTELINSNLREDGWVKIVQRNEWQAEQVMQFDKDKQYFGRLDDKVCEVERCLFSEGEEKQRQRETQNTFNKDSFGAFYNQPKDETQVELTMEESKVETKHQRDASQKDLEE
ncbi:hypothetical protein OXYTRIMIC_276 [Oxytricha trifallax]|uniref:Uncharacterized protein n=1 Tax=Oxytricha trifallax TaxID=1172189 RepID=A0A073HXA4_9SPIT|nr:hypothetical protein OXYTRIMIC_276 [Oxytricha trifallax]